MPTKLLLDRSLSKRRKNMRVKRKQIAITAGITWLLISLSLPNPAENFSTIACAESFYLTKQQTDSSANQLPNDTSEQNLSETSFKGKRILSKSGVQGLSIEFVGGFLGLKIIPNSVVTTVWFFIFFSMKSSLLSHNPDYDISRFYQKRIDHNNRN